jgi:hypothetical protein
VHDSSDVPVTSPWPGIAARFSVPAVLCRSFLRPNLHMDCTFNSPTLYFLVYPLNFHLLSHFSLVCVWSLLHNMQNEANRGSCQIWKGYANVKMPQKNCHASVAAHFPKLIYHGLLYVVSLSNSDFYSLWTSDFM